jgi:thiol-disulfide isomerase/thioredoxin
MPAAVTKGKILKYRLFFFTAFLWFCFLAVAVSPAQAGVTVQPIGEAALDELISNKNDTLIVSFIAAWCGPCIDELPALNNLYRKYKDQGLNVVGISIDLEGAVAIQPVVNKLKIEFPVYWFGDKAIQKFNLTAIPLLLVIKRGIIVERLPGRRSDKFLDAKVQEILH